MKFIFLINKKTILYPSSKSIIKNHEIIKLQNKIIDLETKIKELKINNPKLEKEVEKNGK
jgi:cell division protein FtsL